MDLGEILENCLDVIERERPLGMAGQLHPLPGHGGAAFDLGHSLGQRLIRGFVFFQAVSPEK